MQDLLTAIQVLYKFSNTACVAERGRARLTGFDVGGALVGERDFQSFVQEGQFPQTLGKGVVVELGGGEDGLIGQEVNLGSAPLAAADLAQLASGHAATEVHLPGVVVAPDLDIELLDRKSTRLNS